MSKEIITQITINGTKEQVWNILMATESYPKWNPFIKQIEGILQEGNRITVNIDTMIFTPVIVTFNKHKELKWLGKLLIKGLFDGEHRFYIQENKNDTVTFFHSEKFTGLLVPFFKKALMNTEIQFQKMNEALKDRVEQLGN